MNDRLKNYKWDSFSIFLWSNLIKVPRDGWGGITKVEEKKNEKEWTLFPLLSFFLSFYSLSLCPSLPFSLFFPHFLLILLQTPVLSAIACPRSVIACVAHYSNPHHLRSVCFRFLEKGYLPSKIWTLQQRQLPTFFFAFVKAVFNSTQNFCKQLRAAIVYKY